MKRSLLFFAMTLSLMVSLFGAAFSPAAAASGGGKSITLVGAQYISGKGVVFTFEITGNFKDFGGVVKIEGVTFNLTDCHEKDNGMLSCVGEKGLSQFIGRTAFVTLNGFSSSALIRNASIMYCYSVYDWDQNNVWKSLGTYCQHKPAKVGDSILYYNPYWKDNLPHLFFTDGIFCFHAGKAYYFPAC